MEKKIAVTGEGPTDYGRETYDKGLTQWAWGPIRHLMDRCIENYGQSDYPEFVAIHKQELKTAKLLRSDKKLEGLSIPARKFKNYCRENKLQYGVFYADADKRESSGKTMREARKHFEEVYSEVEKGLGGEEEKNFIPMIPLKMIENWLLADEEAFQTCYRTSVKLPGAPELIWGDKHNPDSDYPKHVMNRVLSQIKTKENCNQQETFCELATTINIETLREKCPISFERFYRDFGGLLQQLTS